MKLTEQERLLVEDNHNFIYGVIRDYKLNHDDWYDLLALELCYSVQKYDPTKGTLGNYFYRRCEKLMLKEYSKTQLQKNKNNGVIQLTELQNHTSEDNVEEMVALTDLFDGEYGEILRLKADGYTQSEIADKLGVTQSYISKILGKVKREYYDR